MPRFLLTSSAFCLALSACLVSPAAFSAARPSTPAPSSQPPAAMEAVQMDPNTPSFPAAMETPIANPGKLSLEEAKDQLQDMLDVQKTMMQQIQVLQARIENAETETADTRQQMQALANTTQQQAGAIDTLSQRVRVSGYGEMGWRMFTHAPRTDEYLEADGGDGNLFDLRRINLRYNVQFTEKASWYGEVEMEDAGLDEISVEESAFNYSYKPWLNFRAGLLIPQLTYTNVNHDGPARLLVDRPLVDQFVVPSTYRDLGAGIYGFVPLKKHGAFNYDLMVLNGFTDIIDAGATAGSPVSSTIDFNGLRRIRPSRDANNDRFRDNNDNKAVYARLGYTPFPGLEIGVAAHTGKYDEADSKNLTILSGDLQYRYKRFSLLAEYANALFQRGNGLNSQGIAYSLFPTSTNGYFVQAAYDLTQKLKAIAAYNLVDFDEGQNGNTMQRVSLGLRYNPYKRVFFKTEYQLTTGRSRFYDEHTSNALLTQITFAF